jgi:hypothetical protein
VKRYYPLNLSSKPNLVPLVNNFEFVLVLFIEAINAVTDGYAVAPQVVIHPHDPTRLENLKALLKVKGNILNQMTSVYINEVERLVILLVKLIGIQLYEFNLRMVLALGDVIKEHVLRVVSTLFLRRRGVITVKWVYTRHTRLRVIEDRVRQKRGCRPLETANLEDSPGLGWVEETARECNVQIARVKPVLSKNV